MLRFVGKRIFRGHAREKYGNKFRLMMRVIIRNKEGISFSELKHVYGRCIFMRNLKRLQIAEVFRNFG